MQPLVVTKKAKTSPANGVVQGHFRIGNLTLPCAIGASGIFHDKWEGDRATPAGAWPLLGGYFRADRGPRPRAFSLLTPLRRDFGWCDDVASPAYNRPVLLPFAASHEVMWRDDGLYDIVIVLGHNFHPRHKRRGSAIFLHCARDDLAPTAGCVALRKPDFRRLLPRLAPNAVLIVK